METKAGDAGPAPKEAETKAPDATAAKDQEPEGAAVEDAGDDDVPDPDEDDLDDLDDMLDDFSAVKVDDTKPGPVPSGRDRPGGAPGVAEPAAEDALSDDEFARQLQAGMAELMGEIENSPEVAAQFESIFNELGAAAVAAGNGNGSTAGAGGTGSSAAPDAAAAAKAPSALGSQGSSAASAAAEASFQETIRRTMERMQASGDQATAATAAAADEEGADDFMAELLRQMQSGGAGLEGPGGEEEFSKMLLGVMEQLTNKDILYEPMKELNDKFPGWMEKNAATVSDEDRKRYEEQQGLVKEILARFDEPGYSDANAADREYIVDRMQKMQAAGSPPSDLVGDMPSAQEAFGAPGDESCNPQ